MLPIVILMIFLARFDYKSLTAATKIINRRLLSKSYLSMYTSKASSCENDRIVQISGKMLSDEELDLLKMLRDVSEQECKGTTIRVAGGWVRDKLLGLSGKPDIDIALDTMSGREFALVLNRWCKDKGRKIAQIGIIQQNPDKSKHLETATIQLGKFAVDLVNLRTESYANDSRIPTIEIGTPAEDALRRDLTINALFFNVHNNMIEDFTGKGLDDLRAKIVRTPLPALTTLLDDPLRSLRAVRFACRLQFSIAEDLIVACTDASVRSALNTKVSRERISQELQLMLTQPQQVRAAVLLHGLGLLPMILSLPNSNSLNICEPDRQDCLDSFGLDSFNRIGVCTLLIAHSLRHQLQNDFLSTTSTAQALRLPRLQECPAFLSMLKTLTDPEALKILSYASLTLLGSRFNCPNPLKRGKSMSTVDYILQQSLKMKSKDITATLNLQAAASGFTAFIEDMIKGPTPKIDSTGVMGRSVSGRSDDLCQSSGNTGGASAAVAAAAANDKIDQHAVNGIVQNAERVRLGLLIRAGGSDYRYAIVLAASRLLLEAATEGVSTALLRRHEMTSGPGMSAAGGSGSTVLSIREQALVSLTQQLVQQISRADTVAIDNALSPLQATVEQSGTSGLGTSFDCGGELLAATLDSYQTREILDSFERLVVAIDSMNLSDAWKLTPALNGGEVSELFQGTDIKGPTFGKIMNAQISWMLSHPDGDIDDLKRHLLLAMKAFIHDLPEALIAGKNVLLRVDLNVPLGPIGEDGFPSVADMSKIRAILPTVDYLKESKARSISLCSHLGRPSAGKQKGLSLQALVGSIRSIYSAKVEFVGDCVGEKVQEAVASATVPGTILLLENTRFHLEEELNDAQFSELMAMPFDLYVNDAFASAHRAHASTEGVTKFIEFSVGGLLMEKEVTNLSRVMKTPTRPFAAIIGGSKISTKIPILFKLLETVDKLIIGGGMVFTFYKSLGYDVGNSLVEAKFIPVADSIIREAKKRGVVVILAMDVVIADSKDTPTYVRTVRLDEIPDDAIGLDIGPQSVREFRSELEGCQTVVWNGPMGAFEWPLFQNGTQQMTEIITELTSKGCTTVVCGGDTVAAVQGQGDSSFTLISTGGGATLEFMEGRSLPGIESLCNRNELVADESNKTQNDTTSGKCGKKSHHSSECACGETCECYPACKCGPSQSHNTPPKGKVLKQATGKDKQL